MIDDSAERLLDKIRLLYLMLTVVILLPERDDSVVFSNEATLFAFVCY